MDWYVAYTNVQAEKKAEAGLLRKGFATFLPLQMTMIKRRGKRKLIERPLFPRYLFIGGGLKNSWHVDGVQGLLANEGRPLTVHESLVGGLMDAISKGEFSDKEPARIRAGAHVRFMRGPFEGMAGVCNAVQSETRVEVAIELLKREVFVKVPSCCLMIAE